MRPGPIDWFPTADLVRQTDVGRARTPVWPIWPTLRRLTRPIPKHSKSLSEMPPLFSSSVVQGVLAQSPRAGLVREARLRDLAQESSLAKHDGRRCSPTSESCSSEGSERRKNRGARNPGVPAVTSRLFASPFRMCNRTPSDRAAARGLPHETGTAARRLISLMKPNFYSRLKYDSGVHRVLACRRRGELPDQLPATVACCPRPRVDIQIARRI